MKNEKTSVKKDTSVEVSDTGAGKYPMRIPVRYVKKKRSSFGSKCIKFIGGFALFVAYIIFLALMVQIRDAVEDLNDILNDKRSNRSNSE